jgi:hypothetical protein
MMPKYGLIIFLVATFGLTTTTMFSVQLLLPPLLLQKAYADEYTVSDEASCLALPPGSRSPSWVSSSNTCEIDGTLTIAAGDTLTISSGITVEITISGTISNDGIINNVDGGTINNGGTINDGGTINNNQGGNINNNVDGIINNDGGTINNGGIINNYGGNINNNGIINNGGTINNGGKINNFDGGNINNNGTINNVDGGNINNFGTINNNQGGFIDNDGNIINKCGGNINNNGGTISGNPVVNEPCKLGERGEPRVVPGTAVVPPLPFAHEEEDGVFCFGGGEDDFLACFNTEKDCQDTQEFLERLGIDPHGDCDESSPPPETVVSCSVTSRNEAGAVAGFQCNIP